MQVQLRVRSVGWLLQGKKETARTKKRIKSWSILEFVASFPPKKNENLSVVGMDRKRVLHWLRPLSKGVDSSMSDVFVVYPFLSRTLLVRQSRLCWSLSLALNTTIQVAVYTTRLVRDCSGVIDNEHPARDGFRPAGEHGCWSFTKSRKDSGAGEAHVMCHSLLLFVKLLRV